MNISKNVSSHIYIYMCVCVCIYMLSQSQRHKASEKLFCMHLEYDWMTFHWVCFILCKFSTSNCGSHTRLLFIKSKHKNGYILLYTGRWHALISPGLGVILRCWVGGIRQGQLTWSRAKVEEGGEQTVVEGQRGVYNLNKHVWTLHSITIEKVRTPKCMCWNDK